MLLYIILFLRNFSNQKRFKINYSKHEARFCSVEKEISALDTTLNLKINKLNIEIDSLKSENNYLRNEVYFLITKPQEVEVLEEEDERKKLIV